MDSRKKTEDIKIDLKCLGKKENEMPWMGIPVRISQGFSNVAFLTSGAGKPFGLRCCPVHCRMLSSIPGLSPLDANSTPHSVVTTKNVSRHCQMFPGRQNHPHWRTTALNRSGMRFKMNLESAIFIYF